jgi:PAP2 superfamily
MKTVSSITQIYRSHLEPMDHLVLNLEMILAFSGLVFLALNAVTFRYSGIHFISFHGFLWAPIPFFFVLFSRTWKSITPKYYFILKSYSLYALAIISLLILLDGVQLTPFPTIDGFLAQADTNFKINEKIMENWTITHPLLRHLLKLAYHSVTAQWLLMPLILYFSRQQCRFNLYLVASLMAFLLGSAIYYFFPSLSPTFLPDRQHLVPVTFEQAMMVFPTFHVMLAIINITIWRRSSIGYFMPMLLINLAAVFATLLLGWNYGVHILLGVIMAFFAFYFAKRLLVTEKISYLTTVNFGGPFGRGAPPPAPPPS